MGLNIYGKTFECRAGWMDGQVKTTLPRSRPSIGYLFRVSEIRHSHAGDFECHAIGEPVESATNFRGCYEFDFGVNSMFFL